MKTLKALSVLLFGIALAACGTSTREIHGDIAGLDGKIYLETYTNDMTSETDSIAVTDGRFMFKINNPDVSFGRIISFNHRFFVPLIFDSKKIDITGDMNERTISGSPLSAKMNEPDFFKGPYDSIERGAPEEETKAAMETWKSNLLADIKENKDNMLGVLLATDNTYYLSPEEVFAYMEELSPEMQQTYMVQKEIERARAKINREEGNEFTDIKLPDADGNELSLSDYAGKGNYVLLDFWASWCGPCLAEIPALKEIYLRYHDRGFEVFAVSLDSGRDEWLKAIEKHELTWIHVSSLAGWKCPGAALYGVNSIPSTVLVGPDGVIVKNNPHSADIEKILSEAYGK